MRLARTDALDAVIDGADAGRQEQPFRRVHGQRRDRGSPRAASPADGASRSLTLVRLVGDAGDGAELAAGNRGGHADLAHRRRVDAAATPPLPARIRRYPRRSRISLARQICTALAPSVIEPPPTVTMRSAPAARACSDAAITAARGVCAGIASNVPTQRAPSAVRIFSISSVSRFSVPLTIRKARLAPSRSNCATIASAPAVRKPPRPWRRIRHAPCARLSSRRFWLCCDLADNLAKSAGRGTGKWGGSCTATGARAVNTCRTPAHRPGDPVRCETVADDSGYWSRRVAAGD